MIHLRWLAALALVCALFAPARADTTTPPLTAAWTKIAAAGASVDLQVSNGTVYVTTSAAAPAAGSAGHLLVTGEHWVRTLTLDLYARVGRSADSAVILLWGVSAPLPPGTSTLAAQTQIDTDLKTALPRIVQPGGVTIAQTVVTLAAGASAPLIGANASRKYLQWMVTGTNPMTVVPGVSAAVVGIGMNYNGVTGPGPQGSSEDFKGTSVPTNAFQAISAGGTTVTVWEGQ